MNGYMYDNIDMEMSVILILICSVRGGLVYSQGWDCSDSEGSMAAYVNAMNYMKDRM